MKPFRPNAKQTLKSYYRVPIDIIEDGDQLWRVGGEKRSAVRRRSGKLQ